MELVSIIIKTFCLADILSDILCSLSGRLVELELTLMMSMSGEGGAGEGEGEEQRVVTVTGELMSLPL